MTTTNDRQPVSVANHILALSHLVFGIYRQRNFFGLTDVLVISVSHPTTLTDGFRF